MSGKTQTKPQVKMNSNDKEEVDDWNKTKAVMNALKVGI